MLSRILLVTNEFPPEKAAGTAMSTSFLAGELVRREHHVTVVVNTRRSAPAWEVNGNLEIVRLRPLDVPLTRMAQRAGMLVHLARRIRPEIIQGQSLSCGALAALAGRLLGIPSVVYVQGLDLYESGPWAQRTYIRWALTHGDVVASVTADLQRRALALSGRRAEVIPHGLQLRQAHGISRREARRSLGLPQDIPIVLHVGRLIDVKGAEYLLRAMPAVWRAHDSVLLLVIGDGDRREALERLAGDLDARGRIRFLGVRPHEDVILHMRAADVFVLPSLMESFGIVLIEAMSCGLPVVASDVMGIPSIITDRTNGFLVPPADPGSLADRVVRLLGDPEARETIASRNVQEASTYAIGRVADRFLEIWEQAVRGRGR